MVQAISASRAWTDVVVAPTRLIIAMCCIPGYKAIIKNIDTMILIVIDCISCHRAHGSAENDILRFDYTTQQAGGGNDYGCLGCHSLQR